MNVVLLSSISHPHPRKKQESTHLNGLTTSLPKRVHRCRLGEVVSLANTRIVLPAQAAESFESDDDEKDLRPGGVSAEAGKIVRGTYADDGADEASDGADVPLL